VSTSRISTFDGEPHKSPFRAWGAGLGDTDGQRREPNTSDGFVPLSQPARRRLIKGLLQEWGAEAHESSGDGYIDFHVNAMGPLLVEVPHRYRLFHRPVDGPDLVELVRDAEALHEVPIAIAACGVGSPQTCVRPVKIINAVELDELCRASGVVVRNASRVWEVDQAAYRELRDTRDNSLALVSGLLALRPLARNAIPAWLRWTGRTPDDLFEQSFFVTATTVFQATGKPFGQKKRGLPGPDGVLRFPVDQRPTLYDCKAYADGYPLEFRDLVAFADYLRNPSRGTFDPVPGVAPRFLVISSEVHTGTREASYAARQKALKERVPGATLSLLRATDLVRFGVCLERIGATPDQRRAIPWTQILDAGDIRWPVFEAVLNDIKNPSS
jgi:hypothetical protein